MGEPTTREQVFKTDDLLEGRYRIIKTLGEGGMGSVFLAEHTLIKRRVAIKVLHPELATDPSVVERFMNEARAAGTLGHPNIVESTDMGFTANHVPYIVFEYLEGTLLTDEVYRVCGLPVRRVIHIAQQIASALHAAHNAGIIHRDLKSDNVFLTDKDDALDHVKVLDFGISRFLQIEDERSRGMVMGTPEFMAPEQITAPESVDKRIDVYALGVIMYEMLTARRPFRDDDARALMHRIVAELPPPIDTEGVPPALAEMILRRMLAKDPEQRFQTMLDVTQGLEGVLTDADLPRRYSREISIGEGRPARSAETPWPPPQRDTLDPIPVLRSTQKRAQARRAVNQRRWLIYGLTGAGLAMGAGGFVLGSRSSAAPETRTAAAPAPVPATAPLPAARPAPVEPKPAKLEISLDADAPGARVTFRRRIAATPMTMQVSASDVVEFVEVSAPGWKTVRYWLTFDRPTHLTAHLTKGEGRVEATDEQTLIALGELAAPAASRPVAAIDPPRPSPRPSSRPSAAPATRASRSSRSSASKAVGAPKSDPGAEAPARVDQPVTAAKPADPPVAAAKPADPPVPEAAPESPPAP